MTSRRMVTAVLNFKWENNIKRLTGVQGGGAGGSCWILLLIGKKMLDCRHWREAVGQMLDCAID